jgi:magnesium transporter
MKMLDLDRASGKVKTEQISIVVGQGYLLSFQEGEGDVFNPIRQRISQKTARVRQRGTDYLGFAIMDAVVDNYQICIQYFGLKIEDLVDKMLDHEDMALIKEINLVKREINSLRRIVRPVIDVATHFEKTDSELLLENTIPFIKDLQDQSIQAGESLEMYKELLNEELNIFHTNMSTRLNDILRVLTIFSVVFIPLTFIAGIYGTNFEHFPELGFYYAYPIFWGVLILTAGLMLYYFKRKKWL